MKSLTINCRWESNHTVEVPDDFELPESLHDWPQDILDQVDTLGAMLTDWTTT